MRGYAFQEEHPTHRVSDRTLAVARSSAEASEINVGDIADAVARIAGDTPAAIERAAQVFVELALNAGTATQRGLAHSIATSLRGDLARARASAWRS